ncbi:4-aminobutyrate--2-oxoglutarate transaminase [Ktedonosporobacter rubrisoli]|uniref:(S)-3-amino-2-methylpropionate transaminase n=1 Tax=Ktedonosporobacter rubrisoli TaxID=2509675 RepID=A0A4P6JMT2_KTERU|nr:4-aminobutyrate--2-oxoglutarate transaminase [Ktedonosporobacter rubrisoli]QBD76597.1 4-aminobutyrate--2-oxoglutarate transaminase [Ktedonosporobacter rubrisoli]
MSGSTTALGKKSADLLAQRDQYIARAVHSETDIFAERAEGAVIEDVDGNHFIDFAVGHGAVNIGHSRPEIVKAVVEQAEKFMHTSFTAVMYESYVALARRLAAITPGKFAKKAAFFTTGAEAVENAVKIARFATGRPAIIVFDQAFHGRTLLAMTMTARVKPYKYGFGPYAPEVYRAPFPYEYRMDGTPEEITKRCIDELKRLFVGGVAPDKVAAVVVEPVQGEGGMIPPTPGFLPALKAICEEHGILFIADEIQSGFCRTGRMFAVEHENVVPDLIVLAKSLGAGMPISGVIGRAEIMDALPSGSLGGTYSGNPLACVAALAVLDLFEKEDMAAKSRETGKIVIQRLKKLQERVPAIGDVRGLGGMIGIEFVKDPQTREPDPELVNRILAESHRRGLVLVSAGIYDNVIRILAPLSTTPEQLEKALSIFEEAIVACTKA